MSNGIPTFEWQPGIRIDDEDYISEADCYVNSKPNDNVNEVDSTTDEEVEDINDQPPENEANIIENRSDDDEVIALEHASVGTLNDAKHDIGGDAIEYINKQVSIGAESLIDNLHQDNDTVSSGGSEPPQQQQYQDSKVTCDTEFDTTQQQQPTYVYNIRASRASDF